MKPDLKSRSLLTEDQSVSLAQTFKILTGHFLYVTRNVSSSNAGGAWAAYEFEQPRESRLDRYIAPGEYWQGLSYGIAGAFAVFCLVRVNGVRRAGGISRPTPWSRS